MTNIETQLKTITLMEVDRLTPLFETREQQINYR